MPGKLGLKSDTSLLSAKNTRTPLGPDSAGRSHVPYVANDSKATPVGAFHYYASGRLALFENRMYAGKYYWLYADNERNTVLCQFDPLGQGHACFPNGKLRLTSTKAGGTHIDEAGSVLTSWTDAKPLRGEGVSFALNGAATFSFRTRYNIQLKLTLGGRAFEFELGEQLAHAATNYALSKVGTHSLGPERGKAILDLSALNRSTGKATDVSLGKKTRLTEADLTIAALHPILRDADEVRLRVQGMLAQPWIDASLLPSRSFGPATDPRTFETSMDDARWAAFLGKTPASDYAPLPVSAVLRSASGRYRTGAGAKSARVRLRLIDAASYDEFVGRGVAHDALLVVCCLAAWLPQSNRAEQWLEALNGELAAERAAAPSGRADGGGGGGGGVPFVLAKFDMSQSRLLKERHNIHTIPMYLMYYNGRLAYASNVLNGYGASAEDLRAQVAETRAQAQAGNFLPDGFRFGKTDNALMEDMRATLKGR
ncbi:hypothetical protein KFE25_005717 [Diacronema lutheri]|uniref:FAM194 C-terminal domain-containing protein n=1 Tax=Diacronema lutheri TaxID=2081491 RepID=A0A8J5X2I2_DIALT|nr:hypothetical protein KFE25_005717 [Diacronema lutheri]